jgi:hypothetical protein|tara:strand:- start:345 stop:467 length:123 start_codon:yes stop_codon:yes gene_type:complete
LDEDSWTRKDQEATTFNGAQQWQNQILKDALWLLVHILAE